MSPLIFRAAIIFLLPALTFAFLALFNKRIKRNGDFIACSALAVSLFLSITIFVEARSVPENILALFTFEWLPLGNKNWLSGGILIDKLTAVMLIVVTVVSFLVHLFSIKYLENDRRYGRYYCGLLLFTTSMLGLVLSSNLLFLFIFWELVGLSSYLLIGHWFEKKSASDAAMKAFITTRIGDIGMLIGLLICFLQVGSLEFGDLFAAVQTGVLSGDFRLFAGLGLFFGAMGKSAQFPLHVWLPDAMEGPTPVSALIHAATMVAAGVYLVARLFPLFDQTSLLVIAYTGGITVLFAATIAVVQDDIKKVLAYSTVSQLGYMMLALGVGGYSAGIFHLTTHAFFKACLFLGSGAVIYAMHHEQSLSKYGGLWQKMPKTAFCYLLATLAIAGFPGFSGFWSKDAIIADVLQFTNSTGHYFLFVAALATVFITAFYMFRQYLLTFAGRPRDLPAYEHAKEVPWQMLSALIVLAVLSVCSGGLGKWFGEMNPKLTISEQIHSYAKAGLNTPLVNRALALNSELDENHEAANSGHHGSHDVHTLAMVLSTGLAFSGIALAFLMYFNFRGHEKGVFLEPTLFSQRFPTIYLILFNKYYIDELYELIFIKPVIYLSRFFSGFDRLVIDSVVNAFSVFGRVGAVVAAAFDKFIVDRLMVLGAARMTTHAGNRLALLQSGYIRDYLLFVLIGLLLVAGMFIIFFAA